MASDYGLRADGFAAKGVIHARIALHAEVNDNKDDKDRKNHKEPAKKVENTLDVFVTHLEARDAAIREQQYVELADFIKKTSDRSCPMLLMGDINTAGMPEQRSDPNSQYSKLMALQRRKAQRRHTRRMAFAERRRPRRHHRTRIRRNRQTY